MKKVDREAMPPAGFIVHTVAVVANSQSPVRLPTSVTRFDAIGREWPAVSTDYNRALQDMC